jgi:predicted porin
MKQTLLTAAVSTVLAGSMVVAQADTTLYGGIALDIRNTDVDNGKSGASMNNDEGSKIGLKGSEDIGSGTQVIWKLEWDVNPVNGSDASFTGSSGSPGGGKNLTQRDQYLGMKSDLGQLVFGTTSTAYKSAAGKIDPFYETTFEARGFLNQMSGLHSGTGDNGQGRANNVIRYDSPGLKGASVTGTYSLNNADSSPTVSNKDPYSLGLQYDNGPLYAAVDYITNDAGGDDQAYSFGAKYLIESLGVSLGGMYEIDKGMISRAEGLGGATLQSPDNNVDGANQWYGYATYGFGNALLYGSYGKRENSSAGKDGQDAWSVALDYHFSKRTDAWIGYGSQNRNGDSAGGTCGNVNSSCNVAAIGARHNF